MRVVNISDEMIKHRDDFNRAAVQLLFSDLELALTFASIAASQNDPQSQALGNAREAFEQISRLRRTVTMEANEAMRLDAGLRLLKERLSELGELFDQS